MTFVVSAALKFIAIVEDFSRIYVPLSPEES